MQVQSWLQGSNNIGILNTCTRLWLTESKQATPADSIKDIVWSSIKVPEFNKHLKKARRHIGWNVVEITIKMKTIVWKPLMIKIHIYIVHVEVATQHTDCKRVCSQARLYHKWSGEWHQLCLTKKFSDENLYRNRKKQRCLERVQVRFIAWCLRKECQWWLSIFDIVFVLAFVFGRISVSNFDLM